MGGRYAKAINEERCKYIYCFLVPLAANLFVYYSLNLATFLVTFYFFMRESDCSQLWITLNSSMLYYFAFVQFLKAMAIPVIITLIVKTTNTDE